MGTRCAAHGAATRRASSTELQLRPPAQRSVDKRRARTGTAQYQAQGRELARRAEPLHIAGCMLYWAEGERSRHDVRFANSDPSMVAFFVGFLPKYFALRAEAFTVRCNLFADHADDQHRIERFWLETLELPTTCLRKSTVNVLSNYSKKKRLNKLPYGTCRVTVHSTCVVQSIYGSIQEYGGFDRPEWLG